MPFDVIATPIGTPPTYKSSSVTRLILILRIGRNPNALKIITSSLSPVVVFFIFYLIYSLIIEPNFLFWFISLSSE